MLDNLMLNQWYEKQNIGSVTRSIIDQIRLSPPSRNVKSLRSNVSSRYPSRKMGFTVQFESHKNELAFIYEYEHDSSVLEYYDQPCQIKLSYQDLNGRKQSILHTPDFFIIREDSAGWEECKTEEELTKLAEKSPYRYCKGVNRQWICPPGEQYAQNYGLYYKIRSSAEINWKLLRNIIFLEDYFRFSDNEVNEQAKEEILLLLKSVTGISLEELLQQLRFATPDDVYSLIAKGDIYTNLEEDLLVESKQVQIFLNKTIAITYSQATRRTNHLESSITNIDLQSGVKISWEGQIWTILNVGEQYTSLINENGNLAELLPELLEELVKKGRLTSIQGSSTVEANKAKGMLKSAHPEDLQEANRRYEIIKLYQETGRILDQSISLRTVQKWALKFRNAEQFFGNGYVGLLPHTRQRGNRNRKLSDESIKLMQDWIESYYENPRQVGRFQAFGMFLKDCEEKGMIAPSYKTFSKEITSRKGAKQTAKRAGVKAAYNEKPFYWELETTTPRHGDRPFEVVHIDHTELDIELVCSQTNNNLSRPWATFCTDAYSRRLLAVLCLYDKPSYRSIMLVLRELVRKFNRLPQSIVVDNGREFKSVYFDTLLAHYECTKKLRPTGEPRFGSVCERLFGTTNKEFIHNLAGNTQIMRNVRQVSKSFNPKNLAVWTLSDLYSFLCQWAYEVYDTISHPALGQTPRSAFQQGINSYGLRTVRCIPYDENFLMLTLPSIKKNKAKVISGRGVKVNYIFYWSELFRNSAVEGTCVPIRYDPFDISIAYAYIRNQWVRCISEYYAAFRHRSERELKIASLELRKQKQAHTAQIEVTARKLADFLQSAHQLEALQLQHRRDSEVNKALLALPILTSPTMESEKLEPRQTELANDNQIETNKQSGRIEESQEEFDVYGEYL